MFFRKVKLYCTDCYHVFKGRRTNSVRCPNCGEMTPDVIVKFKPHKTVKSQHNHSPDYCKVCGATDDCFMRESWEDDHCYGGDSLR